MTDAIDPILITTHSGTQKRLGHWTTASEFRVLADHGSVVLDLRSPQIEEGDIRITVELHRATLKLLLPDDAPIDDWHLRRHGRCRVKDGSAPKAPTGRRVVITGNLNSSEIRINRAGTAVLSAMFSREFLEEARRARKEGRTPTVADPARYA